VLTIVVSNSVIEQYVVNVKEMLEADKEVDAGKLLSSLDPPTAYNVIVRLSSEERYRVLAYLTLENLADVLDRFPEDILYEIVVIKGIDEFSKIIDSIPLDKAADILIKLPPRYRSEILAVLSREKEHEIMKLLRYSPESVGGIMTPQIPIFNDSMTVGEAIEIYLTRSRLGFYDRHYYIYAVNSNGKLMGYIDVRSFLTKTRSMKIGECVTKTKIAITVDRDREEAAKLFLEYDLLELPVIDRDGKLLGVVTVDDILDVLVSEYSEDLLKYGGIIEAIKGSYIVSNPLKLALRRIPMIIYLYLMNSITGSIIATFTNVIERYAILAAFLPILSDNSGNIGAQSSSLIIRSLALGELRISRQDILRILLKEFSTTSIMLIILLPIAFAIAFGVSLPLIGLQGGIRIGLVVAVALIVSCYVSDVAGALLPIILARMRLDPAVASAPVVTTIGDIATASTYFFIALLLLGLT
jgi:magnesium transporter